MQVDTMKNGCVCTCTILKSATDQNIIQFWGLNAGGCTDKV